MVYSGGTGANQALKTNRNLIGKRKKKKLSYVTQSDKVKIHKKELDAKDLEQIRAKLKKQKIQESWFLFYCILGALVLLSLISYLIDWRFFWENFR